MKKHKPTYVYKEAVNLEERDVSFLYEKGWYCEKVTLYLRDFTAKGENLPSPHPTYLKYYYETPYWVIVTDVDDYCLVKQFASLQEAYRFYYRFIVDKDNCIKEMR